jgi:N-acetylmuramoyl-L-alanine amidase
VLGGASMPSVLVEAGFLSNKSDADYLKSTRGQYDIAEAIFNSVKSFKTYYDTVIESD